MNFSGNGIIIYRDGNDVHLKSIAETQIFIQCPNYASKSGDHPSTVYRFACGNYHFWLLFECYKKNIRIQSWKYSTRTLIRGEAHTIEWCKSHFLHNHFISAFNLAISHSLIWCFFFFNFNFGSQFAFFQAKVCWYSVMSFFKKNWKKMLIKDMTLYMLCR